MGALLLWGAQDVPKSSGRPVSRCLYGGKRRDVLAAIWHATAGDSSLFSLGLWLVSSSGIASFLGRSTVAGVMVSILWGVGGGWRTEVCGILRRYGSSTR
jgi:hypothetical protein